MNNTPDRFTIQGIKLMVGKVTLAQDIALARYVDKFLLSSDFKGKGLLDIVADALEYLPDLMRIIFDGQPEADTINWLDADTDMLLAIKDIFEKKNPRTMNALKNSFQNSGLQLAEKVTSLLSGIGSIFSSTGQPTEMPPQPITSKATGAPPN